MKIIRITVPKDQIKISGDITQACINFAEKHRVVPVKIIRESIPVDQFTELRPRGHLKSAVSDVGKVHFKIELFSNADYQQILRLAQKSGSEISVFTLPVTSYSETPQPNQKISLLDIKFFGTGSEINRSFKEMVFLCSEVNPDPIELSLKYGENAVRVDLAEKARRYSEENSIPYGDALEIVSMPKKAGK